MELRQLEMFVAVAEEGSIHAAARRLHLAQPSLSQAVRKLERHVGTPLLSRSSRGVELTIAGATFLERTRDILARLDLAVGETRSKGGHRAALRIGLMAGRLSAAELTSSIVTTYKRRRPDVDVTVVELSFADQVAAIADGRVDVAILRPPYDDRRLQLTPLFEEPRLLCFGTDHRFAEADELLVEEVLDEPVLSLSNAPAGWSEFWQLADVRGEPGHVLADPAVTVSELQITLADRPAVISVASSGWRLGIQNPYLKAIPLRGAPPAQVAVGVGDGCCTTEALDFIGCARTVTEELIEHVPDASVCGGIRS